jgi:uncharacterized repeat protein (TIGR03803 family)
MVLVGAIAVGLAGAGSAAPVETTLYGFRCAPDGSSPFAAVVADKTGNLLGTTFSGGSLNIGTAFRLAPPTGGGTSWTESVLYSFESRRERPPATDATSPMGGLLLGHGGVPYGTGYYSNDTGCGGRGCGAVYALLHPTMHSPLWRDQVIYDFLGTPDGANPIGTLISDSTGALYGVTTNGGASGAGSVFRLAPPSTKGQPWTPTILYSFKNQTDGGFPAAGLISDSSGALYGTTADSGDLGVGTVFKLTPPSKSGKPWTESVLYTFGLSGAPDDGDQPMAALVANNSGTLFGTTLFGGTAGRGVVFRLTPPKTGKKKWNETTLYSFQNNGDGALPGAALLLQPKSLYGTTEGTGATGNYGTVFELAQPPAGSTIWTETTLYQFSGGADGKYPLSALIADSAGNFYGTTEAGGPQKCGVVFEVSP